MICPGCGEKTKVIDSREPRDEDNELRVDYPIVKECLHVEPAFSIYQARKRECLSCGERFTSIELPLKEVLALVSSKKADPPPPDPRVEEVFKVFDNLKFILVTKD